MFISSKYSSLYSLELENMQKIYDMVKTTTCAVIMYAVHNYCIHNYALEHLETGRCLF